MPVCPFWATVEEDDSLPLKTQQAHFIWTQPVSDSGDYNHMKTEFWSYRLQRSESWVWLAADGNKLSQAVCASQVQVNRCAGVLMCVFCFSVSPVTTVVFSHHGGSGKHYSQQDLGAESVRASQEPSGNVCVCVCVTPDISSLKVLYPPVIYFYFHDINEENQWIVFLHTVTLGTTRLKCFLCI